MGLLAAVTALDLRPEGLYREVAAIAWHFHWSRGECMAMSRRERRLWIDEIARINREIARAVKPRR